MRAFFYGTLLDEDVRAAVLGPGALARAVEPAVLPGYRRVQIRKRTYPVVVPDPHAEVAGLLMRGLNRAEFTLLTAYETNEYRIHAADVVTASGKRVAANVFVASARALPSPLPWQIADWQRRYKRGFLRRLRAGEGP